MDRLPAHRRPGLILAHHCYANDCALLIPLLAIAILRPGIPRWMKMSAVLLLSPAPVFLVTTIRPFTGQVLVVGFVVSALAVAIPAAQTTTLPLAAVE